VKRIARGMKRKNMVGKRGLKKDERIPPPHNRPPEAINSTIFRGDSRYWGVMREKKKILGFPSEAFTFLEPHKI